MPPRLPTAEQARTNGLIRQLEEAMTVNPECTTVVHEWISSMKAGKMDTIRDSMIEQFLTAYPIVGYEVLGQVIPSKSVETDDRTPDDYDDLSYIIPTVKRNGAPELVTPKSPLKYRAYAALSSTAVTWSLSSLASAGRNLLPTATRGTTTNSSSRAHDVERESDGSTSGYNTSTSILTAEQHSPFDKLE
jgi:hypothetical protein